MTEPATDPTPAAVESTGDSAPEAPPATPETDPPGAEALGDPGKKALDTMKAERNAARDQARDLEQRLAALQAQVEGREAEFQAQQEQQRIADEAMAAANQRILKAELRAAAAGKLNDPADALTFVDLNQFEVGADGEVDSSAVVAAIDSLLASKPYLAAQGRRFQGDADQGPRNEGSQKAAQLTEADVKRLYAEKRYGDIATAKAEGRLRDYLNQS